MRLIDADALKLYIDKEVEENKVIDGWAFFFKVYLDNAPSIDIVRCKECKYFSVVSDEEEGTNYYMCGVWSNATDENASCSYGKERVNND